MKKTTAILLGTLIASSAALAQSNVLSRNAVGYIKHTMGAGFSVLQNTFETMGAPIAISNTFASLPNNSRVYLWNGSSYQTFSKNFLGVWSGGSNTLNRGSALWVEIPASVGTNTYDVFMMGEVPDSVTAPATLVGAGPGFSFVGFPYPVATAWSNTEFAVSAPNNSKLHVWNGSSYQSFSKNFLGSWGAGASYVLSPGQGFWLEYPISASSTNISVTKPYQWP